MDGNDLGMIARVFMFLLKGLKYVLKLVWFTGLWWFCVPLVVGIGYEEITGTFIQNNQIMDGIFTILWYACYVLCPLNFLQNIIRMVKKDRKFSFLELLLHNRQKKGFEAKLGGDTVALKTAKDLSGVVFGKSNGKYATMPESTDGQSAERTSYQPNPIYERQANEIESISKTISEQSRTIKSLQEERDKLGIFKGREKKELQNKIDNFERLRRSNLDKLGALGVSEPSKADEAVKEKRSMAAQEQNRAKAAMQNRGAKERAEEVKAAFLEAAKQIPADQRQEILDRMGQQKEIPTMGRLQYYQAEAEARRQLDTALKQEAQTRERNRTHDRDRGI